MDVHIIIIVVLSFNAFNLGSGLKILGIFPYCAHSHYSLGFRLMKELADRGHDVTFINCFPRKEAIKNYRDVSVEEVKELIVDFTAGLSDFGQMSVWGQLKWISKLGEVYTRGVLKSKGVQELWSSREDFDIVVMEHFVNDALSFFHKRFNCPIVTVIAGPMTMLNNHLAGNPIHPAFVPNILGDYDSKMNFWDRLDNMYKQIIGEIFVQLVHVPAQNNILKEIFPDAPDIKTFLYNSSVLLICSHVSLSDAVPLQQNIKEIGGYHVAPPKPLPQEIQSFMDSAKEGVILFSMGSNLKSSNFEPEKIRAVLKAFSKIKQKVIWKFGADLPDIPENVMISSWLPQSDILAHPKTVGFISHGGLLGTIEAIYHGVPILGLPVYWDQVKNIEEGVRKGYGLRLDLKDLNEVSFEKVFTQLINNPKYLTTARKRSKIMHDLPMKQIDEAVFWIEYVVRHNGAEHLRSTAVTLKWYELYLLDVSLCIVTILTVVLFAVAVMVKVFFGRKKVVEEQKKKN